MSSLRTVSTLAIAAVVLSACGRPPPATPTKAEATKELVICWKTPTAGPDPDEVGAPQESVALKRAIEKRLEGAGYARGAKHCDLRIRWHEQWRERGGDKSYSEATLTLFTPKGDVLDVVRYELERNHFPVEEPDRLAILFVNSINASAKLATYADTQRLKKSPPASETTAPDTTSPP